MKVFERKSILDKILDEKMRYAEDAKEIDYILLTEDEAIQLYEKVHGPSWVLPNRDWVKKVNGSRCYDIYIKVEGME